MTALPDSLLVDVFKTARRPETFLFLPQGLALADWPEGLADVFTPAEKVLSLNLSARQPLAAFIGHSSSAMAIGRRVSRGDCRVLAGG